MSIQSPIIGYTLGDQAGIGPEIICKALAALPGHIRCKPMGASIDCTPGRPTRDTALAALEHLERAAEALRSGEIDAVVTSPICKEAMHKVGFHYPGQTEFFADRMGVKDVVMCLTGKHLTVALCTTHVALCDVPRLLTPPQIANTAATLAAFLRGTGIARPRIALAGLNPHNGENGAFGQEESLFIAPALELLRMQDTQAEYTGPCVPDCVYREAAAGQYDGVVAPYHDQALIPLKLLDFDNAVNATLGMPRLRVSPDHGTAFNIAGRGIASASSTIRAFELAWRSALHA
ncbi:MAG: 4-hydroxythreonine-4-phosphate dehydrogenase PdxA [Akkermansia sp.]|nr:4-hydroxythreonine-4-phosphate dehydrogenase PdxA [Akkermansia sp.]MBQ9835233.1 4-hydroxythreonine-4-phosphate dehydrogenase PdxA [Akkermansia sp.]